MTAETVMAAPAPARAEAPAIPLLLIEERFQEALETSRKLPDKDWARLTAARTSWPYSLPDYPPEARASRQATRAAIGRMDECFFVWLPMLKPYIDAREMPPDIAAIVMARAARVPWPRIARRRQLSSFRRSSPRTLRRLYTAALAAIRARIMADGTPVAPAES